MRPQRSSKASRMVFGAPRALTMPSTSRPSQLRAARTSSLYLFVSSLSLFLFLSLFLRRFGHEALEGAGGRSASSHHERCAVAGVHGRGVGPRVEEPRDDLRRVPVVGLRKKDKSHSCDERGER